MDMGVGSIDMGEDGIDLKIVATMSDAGVQSVYEGDVGPVGIIVGVCGLDVVYMYMNVDMSMGMNAVDTGDVGTDGGLRGFLGCL